MQPSTISQVCMVHLFYYVNTDHAPALPAPSTDAIAQFEIRVGYTPPTATLSPKNSGNPICATHANGPLPNKLNCATVMKGRYVSIQRVGGYFGYLSLCDVKVGAVTACCDKPVVTACTG